MSREEEKCCVVIPAYNEGGRIAKVIAEVKRHCPDVIVVDDGSDDGTADEAEQTGAVVVRHGANKGKGVALATGFAKARELEFDYLITLDGDGQHTPDDIPQFMKAYVNTGIPVLIGNRMDDVRSMPLVRRWTNRYMSWLLSKRMNQVVPDTQNGFRLYRCDVLDRVPSHSAGFAAESEVLLDLAEAGFKIGSVPVRTIYSDEKSKIHPCRDTIRFFGMLRRHDRKWRKGGVE